MSLVIWHNRATLASFLFLNKNFMELKVKQLVPNEAARIKGLLNRLQDSPFAI